MDQNALAARLKRHGKTVSRWENGHSTPRLAVIREIAAILHADVRYLCEGDGEGAAPAKRGPRTDSGLDFRKAIARYIEDLEDKSVDQPTIEKVVGILEDGPYLLTTEAPRAATPIALEPGQAGKEIDDSGEADSARSAGTGHPAGSRRAQDRRARGRRSS